MSSGNTHFALVFFSGDPAGEHDDPDLRGCPPGVSLIAAGPEAYCWDALAKWTAEHPLRLWETAEIVRREPANVRRPSPAGGY